MKKVHLMIVAISILLANGLISRAQQVVATNTNVVVPPLINFSGQLTDANGKPLTGTVGVSFLLYKDQQGGSPLWMETQNVQPDRTGHYTVMLGSTSSAGLPADIFVTGEAHWLGVHVQGQEEQPRVLLVSAPYALKAGDAETIGGLPPSAFVLAAPPAGNGAGVSASQGAAAIAGAPTGPPAASDVTTTGGTVNAVPLFTTSTNIQNSLLTQSGKAAINVVGKLNLPALGLATATAGKNSQPQSFVASVFNSTTSTAVPQTFQWQAEPVGNDTSTATGSLNLLFGSGTSKPVETGLHIASNGQITFATGQTFPGTGNGTVTNVATGLGLTGGPITTTGTLAIDTTKIPQLGAANTFVGNQSITGNLSASGSVTAQVGNFDGTSSSPLLNIVQTGTGDGGVITAATGYAGLLVTGNSIGVQGTANASGGAGLAGYSTNGYGVYGSDSASTGNATGVFGGTSSPNGIGVIGEQSSSASSSSSSGAGVSGATLSPTGFGVVGYEYSTTGTTAGVYGLTSSDNGYGVEGSGPNVGVLGVATVGAGLFNFGVEGIGQGSGTGGGFFMGGLATSIFVPGPVDGVLAYGGEDRTSSGSAAGPGGEFYGGSSTAGIAGTGIYGYAGSGINVDAKGLPVAGVTGEGASFGPGVFGSDGTYSGTSRKSVGTDSGVWGDAGSGGTFGVVATADNTWALGAYNNSAAEPTLGVLNYSTSNTASILLGSTKALNGYVDLGGAGCSSSAYVGLQLGQFGMSNCTNFTMMGDGANTFINAGNGTTTGSIWFRVNNNHSPSAMTINNNGSINTGGNFTVGGTLSVTGTKNFMIDHPLDPANKYLYHAAIESSEVLNLYSGNVTLDASGAAVVNLPDWFEVLNKDFRYQLTPIGQPGHDLYIAEEVSGGHFKIAGGTPGGRVSWQVTGVRNDAWERAHPMVVEADKGADRGHYLTPEFFGQPEEARIGYGDPVPPEVPKRNLLEPRTSGERARSTSRPRMMPPRPAVLAPPKPPQLPKPPVAPTRPVAQARK